MSLHKSFLLILTLIGLLIIISCSADSDSTDMKTEEPKELTQFDKTEQMLNEALVRLSYRDKTGLYEQEFEYMQDEYTFDEYLKLGHIQWAVMDSIDHLELLEMIPEGEDSILCKVHYVFNSSGGKLTKVPDKFYIYRQYDEWRKPTISKYLLQQEYEELIRKAEEDIDDE